MNLYVDDFMIFLYGDGEARKGVDGTMRELIANLSPQELITLLYDDEKRGSLLYTAINTVVSQTDDNYYKFSQTLNLNGITSEDIWSVVNQFQNKLEHDHTAISAMLLAYLRSVTIETVTVSPEGHQHKYELSMLGQDVPDSLLIWSKVSGSNAVTVFPDGTVTIPKYTAEGTAIIQAEVTDPDNGSKRVIFQKEVTLNAEDIGISIPQALLDRMNTLHDAILAGDSEDVQNIRDLQDEIAKLDDAKDQKLIDPVWNKISAKLPASADPIQLKSSLFRIFKAVSSFRYDPQVSELNAILSNPEFRETLNTIAAAGGNSNVTFEDILILFFGDGDKAKGIEGTFRDILADKKPMELAALLSNKNSMDAVFSEALAEVLNQKDTYALNAVLYNLGVTSAEVRSTVLNFQNKLKNDKPAMNALIIAYIRAEAVETVNMVSNGKKHNYGLKVLGIELPSLLLKWTKISGSDDVTVKPNGTVSIPNKAESGTAVIQASLVNPFSREAKVIFQKEVTLVNGDEDIY